MKDPANKDYQLTQTETLALHFQHSAIVAVEIFGKEFLGKNT